MERRAEYPPSLVKVGRTLADLRSAVEDAVLELDAEHYPDPDLKGRGGCVMCWPKDGSWPCLTRMVADTLRSAIGGDQ